MASVAVEVGFGAPVEVGFGVVVWDSVALLVDDEVLAELEVVLVCDAVAVLRSLAGLDAGVLALALWLWP